MSVSFSGLAIIDIIPFALSPDRKAADRFVIDCPSCPARFGTSGSNAMA